MKKLTHLDEEGRARMVDVGGKPPTRRTARAEGAVRMKPETLAMIAEGRIPKGDVAAVARVAGIMAAKGTPSLIPLCHTLSLSSVSVDLAPDAEGSRMVITATASTVGPTGVEMEALTAVAVAALAVYDMCKAVDKAMVIADIRLLEKTGGLSDR
jgi:cyclic pyranopterin phosphate synthase